MRKKGRSYIRSFVKKAAVSAFMLVMAVWMAACSDHDAVSDNVQAGDTEYTDLNSRTVEEITEEAELEGKVISLGMPDEWAGLGNIWDYICSTYGLTHSDTDMSSAEVLSMFLAEGEYASEDIGAMGYGFAEAVCEENIAQSYRTSYWDSVPDWAKDEDGLWMAPYSGVTAFLVNSDVVKDVPGSWQDIMEGDYKVALGDLNSGTAQAGFIASAYAFGGSMDDLGPAVEFWKELALEGRLSTLGTTVANFESGEVTVGIVWSFTAVPYIGYIDQYDMEMAVPEDGVLQSGYISVIGKYAPHPNAAALAREVMFSDAGQTFFALSGAVPVREDFVIAQEYAGEVIDIGEYENVVTVTDPSGYADACARARELWEEEIAPLIVR